MSVQEEIPRYPVSAMEVLCESRGISVNNMVRLEAANGLALESVNNLSAAIARPIEVDEPIRDSVERVRGLATTLLSAMRYSGEIITQEIKEEDYQLTVAGSLLLSQSKILLLDFTKVKKPVGTRVNIRRGDDELMLRSLFDDLKKDPAKYLPEKLKNTSYRMILSWIDIYDRTYK